jgi:hypothetical protein
LRSLIIEEQLQSAVAEVFMIIETELFYLVVAILLTFLLHIALSSIGGGNRRNSHP